VILQSSEKEKMKNRDGVDWCYIVSKVHFPQSSKLYFHSRAASVPKAGIWGSPFIQVCFNHCAPTSSSPGSCFICCGATLLKRTGLLLFRDENCGFEHPLWAPQEGRDA